MSRNTNGNSVKNRRRNQVMLKGRRCRIRRGMHPRRGPGRTAHGRRG